MSGVSIRSRTIGDGSRRFDVRYRRGGRYFPVEHGGTFRTLREATIRRDLVRSLLAAGQDPAVELRRRAEPSRVFSEVASDWLASRRKVADGTREGYRYRMPTLLDRFSDVPVAAIAFEDVVAWVGELEVSYATGTVHLFVRQLRMILDFAGGPNVARDRRVELPRLVTKEPDPPDARVVLQALRKLSADVLLPVVAMEQLGTRISETLALRPSDISVGEPRGSPGRVRIRRETAKGGRSGRSIEVEPWLVDALMERLPTRVGRSGVRDALAASSGKAFHPHDLRHRRATLWHQAGVDPVELARRLGHARPSMSLDVYANVRPLKEVPGHVLASLFD